MGYGDGICCSYGNGGYVIKVEDETVVEGGEFGDSEVESFTVSASPVAPPTSQPIPAPISAPTPAPTPAPTSAPITFTDPPNSGPVAPQTCTFEIQKDDFCEAYVIK